METKFIQDDDIQRIIMCVCDVNGRGHGTAFLVSRDLAVTCAHVIEECNYGPNEQIRLISYVDSETVAAILVPEWLNKSSDIAFLRLQSGPPMSTHILPLGPSRGTSGHHIRSFGFPDTGTAGLWASGQIVGPLSDEHGHRLLQLDSGEIAPGFSGAPVWDTSLQQIIGMVVSFLRPDEFGRMVRAAFAIPIETLQQICSEINLPITQMVPLGWRQLQDVARYVYESRGVSRATDQRDMSLYQERTILSVAFDEFRRSDKTGFILIGKSGVGKSSFLKHLYQECEQASCPDTCFLLYAARELRSDVPLEEVIGTDIARVLQVPQPSDVWAEIDHIVESTGDGQWRQVVLCIDAIDEHPHSPASLLREVDELVRRSLLPWLKVVVTSRSESWNVIVRDLSDFDFANRYYLPPNREWTPDTDWLVFSHELQTFATDELNEVYERYRGAHPRLPSLAELKDLTPETTDAIRDPLLLRLVAEISNDEDISSLSIRHIIPKYLGFLAGKAKKLTMEDVRYLHSELVPEMISIQRSMYSNKLRVPEKTLNPSIVALANAEILEVLRVLEDVGFVQVRFRFERFWDYYSGECLFEELSNISFPVDQFIAIVHELKEKPFLGSTLVSALWSAIVPASGGEQPWTELLLQLAGSADQDCQGVAAAALDEYYRTAPRNQRVATARVLQALYPYKAGRELSPSEERRAVVAMRIAGKLKMTDILKRGMLAQSKLVGDRAVVGAYDLWLGDRKAGFSLLQSTLDPMIRQGLIRTLIFNRKRFECSIRLTMLICARHFREDAVIPTIQQFWQPIIQRYLLYSPRARLLERIIAPVRTALLLLITRLVRVIEQEIPARQSVINFREMRLFYQLPSEIKAKSRELLPFLNPMHCDVRHFADIVWEIFKYDDVNDMVLKLLIDYAFVAQGLHRFIKPLESADGSGPTDEQDARFEEAMALAQELTLAEIAKARGRPDNRLRIQWDKTWVYAAQAHLNHTVSDAFFDDFTHLVDRAVLAGEWWGPLRDHSFVGYADYAHTAMKLQPEQADVLLKRLLAWGVDQQNPQLILDILEELGYLANTQHQELVLKVIEPVLTYKPDWTVSPNPKDTDLVRAVTEKLIEVLAIVRSRKPYSVHALFERVVCKARSDELDHLEHLQSQVLVKKADERIVGDLLKGGVGPWGQFIIEHAFSVEGNPILLWAFETAFSVKTWDQLIFALAQKAVNIVAGTEIFKIPSTPS